MFGEGRSQKQPFYFIVWFWKRLDTTTNDYIYPQFLKVVHEVLLIAF